MKTRRRMLNDNTIASKTSHQGRSHGYKSKAILNTQDVLKALEFSSDDEEGGREMRIGDGITVDTKQTCVAIETARGAVATETSVTAPDSNSAEAVDWKASCSHKVRQVGSSDLERQDSWSGSKEGKKEWQRKSEENGEMVPLRRSTRQRASLLRTKATTTGSLQALTISSEPVEHDCNGAVSSDESAMEADTGGAVAPKREIKNRVLSGYVTKKAALSKRKHKKAVSGLGTEEMLGPLRFRRKKWKVRRLSNRGMLLHLPTASRRFKMRLPSKATMVKHKSRKNETWQNLEKEVVVLDDSLDEEVNVLLSPELNSHDNSFSKQEDVATVLDEECTLARELEDESPDNGCMSPDREPEFSEVSTATGSPTTPKKSKSTKENDSLMPQTSHQRQSSVLDRFPGRKRQIETLKSLFGESWETAVPLIYIYGHPSTGKTAIVQALLQEMNAPHAFVNCIECYTPKILFESVLNQLSGVLPSLANKFTGYSACNSMATFVCCLGNVIAQRSLEERSVYLVLDRAERLRDMDSLVLSAFLRMSELVHSNVCVVLLSRLAWERFFVIPDSPLPLVVYFPQYTKEEVLSILALDCPDDFSPSFYCTFVSHVWNVLHKVCRDLSELRHLSSLLFPLYVAPIKSGEVGSHETMKLWKHIEPYFKNVLGRIYLGDLSSFQWERTRNEATTVGIKEATLSIPELPIHSKFLLIASYLASYNPAKTDQRFFAKGKLRKGRQRRQRDQPNRQEIGPKAFPLDRMLAIFYSILERPLLPSADILSQVSSLVAVQLIARIGLGDLLDLPKFKCLVTFDFIKEIARSVQFDIVKYLYDFN